MNRHQLERALSAARLRALALVPYCPRWDAAMGSIEDLERELWRLEAVPYGRECLEPFDAIRVTVPA